MTSLPGAELFRVQCSYFVLFESSDEIGWPVSPSKVARAIPSETDARSGPALGDDIGRYLVFDEGDAVSKL
jgi:hypothetical protein